MTQSNHESDIIFTGSKHWNGTNLGKHDGTLEILSTTGHAPAPKESHGSQMQIYVYTLKVFKGFIPFIVATQNPKISSAQKSKISCKY